MIFRQLFDASSSTYAYLLGDPDSGEAVLIDPVWEQFNRDSALVRELGLELQWTLETHVHADHVTAAWLMRERLGSRIVVSSAGGAEGADHLVSDGDVIDFGSESLEVRATPGHTKGCVSYVTGSRTMVFTGDALLVRSAGRTDFQEGDARTLYRSVRHRLFTLPDDCLVYPGHDYLGRTATSIGEEKVHNPRLGGDRSEDDFVGYMANLGLPHPKQMAVAVPANLRCGRPDEAGSLGAPLAAPTWAPVVKTYAGVPTVEPEWLGDHLGEVAVVDVREPDEYTGELGHIPGALLIPLGDLRRKMSDVSRERPVVTVCRSGGRSAQAALILEKEMGKVANLAGGMVRWVGQGLPTEGRRRL